MILICGRFNAAQTRAGREVDVEDDRLWMARYRVGANEARQRGNSATSEDVRQILLKRAAEYDELAAELEHRIALKNSKLDKKVCG